MRKKLLIFIIGLFALSIGSVLGQFVFSEPQSNSTGTGVTLAPVDSFVHTVTLHARGGTVEGEEVKTLTVVHGETVNLPTPVLNSDDIYSAANTWNATWRNPLTGTAFDGNVTVHENLELYAEYVIADGNLRYLFLYNEGGGKGSGAAGILGPAGTLADGTISVPSNIDGFTIETICPGAFENCQATETSLQLPMFIKKIEKRAFYQAKFKSIIFTLIYNGKQLEEIEDEAFYQAKGLPSSPFIFISSSLKKIGDSAFRETDMEEVTLSGKLELIGEYAFANCTQLTSLTVKSGAVPKLQEIGEYAFYQCNNIPTTTIYLPEDTKVYPSTFPATVTVERY